MTIESSNKQMNSACKDSFSPKTITTDDSLTILESRAEGRRCSDNYDVDSLFNERIDRDDRLPPKSDPWDTKTLCNMRNEEDTNSKVSTGYFLVPKFFPEVLNVLLHDIKSPQHCKVPQADRDQFTDHEKLVAVIAWCYISIAEEPSKLLGHEDEIEKHRIINDIRRFILGRGSCSSALYDGVRDRSKMDNETFGSTLETLSVSHRDS